MEEPFCGFKNAPDHEVLRKMCTAAGHPDNPGDRAKKNVEVLVFVCRHYEEIIYKLQKRELASEALDALGALKKYFTGSKL